MWCSYLSRILPVEQPASLDPLLMVCDVLVTSRVADSRTARLRWSWHRLNEIDGPPHRVVRVLTNTLRARQLRGRVPCKLLGERSARKRGLPRELSDRAQRDIVAIYDWLRAQQAADGGQRWFVSLRDAIGSLSTLPSRCSMAREGRDSPVDVRQLVCDESRTCTESCSRQMATLFMWFTSGEPTRPNTCMNQLTGGLLVRVQPEEP